MEENNMSSFLVRLVINALAIAATAWLLPGITVGGNAMLTIILVALIFGIVNAIIKPIFSFVTCGLYVITLGLFTFIANALMLWFTEDIAKWFGLQFSIDSFWTAIIGALIISVVSFILSLILGGKNRGRPRES
jgi:putative membrane protein